MDRLNHLEAKLDNVKKEVKNWEDMIAQYGERNDVRALIESADEEIKVIQKEILALQKQRLIDY